MATNEHKGRGGGKKIKVVVPPLQAVSRGGGREGGREGEKGGRRRRVTDGSLRVCLDSHPHSLTCSFFTGVYYSLFVCAARLVNRPCPPTLLSLILCSASNCIYLIINTILDVTFSSVVFVM